MRLLTVTTVVRIGADGQPDIEVGVDCEADLDESSVRALAGGALRKAAASVDPDGEAE